MNKLFTLLILYQLKHFLCDFPLQNKYMLGKFKKYPDFVLPLLAHSLVHALFTLIISICCAGPLKATTLAILDLLIHFWVDRIKASPKLLGRFKNFTGNDYIFIQKGYEPPVWDLAIGYAKKTLTKKREKEIMKSNTLFWWSLGLDQLCHHLTHYFIIWELLK